jgi:hypothetical protein
MNPEADAEEGSYPLSDQSKRAASSVPSNSISWGLQGPQETADGIYSSHPYSQTGSADSMEHSHDERGRAARNNDCVMTPEETASGPSGVSAAHGHAAPSRYGNGIRQQELLARPSNSISSSSSSSASIEGAASRNDFYSFRNGDVAVEASRHNSVHPGGHVGAIRPSGSAPLGERSNVFSGPRIPPAQSSSSSSKPRNDANQMRLRAARQANRALKTTSIGASSTPSFASLQPAASRRESDAAIGDNVSSEYDADVEISPRPFGGYVFNSSGAIPAHAAAHPSPAGAMAAGFFDPFGMSAHAAGHIDPGGVYMFSPVMHDPATAAAYYAQSPSATMFVFPYHPSFGRGYSPHGMMYRPPNFRGGPPVFPRASDSDPSAASGVSAMSGVESSGSLSTPAAADSPEIALPPPPPPPPPFQPHSQMKRAAGASGVSPLAFISTSPIVVGRGHNSTGGGVVIPPSTVYDSRTMSWVPVSGGPVAVQDGALPPSSVSGFLQHRYLLQY